MNLCACGRRARGMSGTRCHWCATPWMNRPLGRPKSTTPQRYLPRQQRPVAGDLPPHLIDVKFEQARAEQRRKRWTA